MILALLLLIVANERGLAKLIIFALIALIVFGLPCVAAWTFMEPNSWMLLTLAVFLPVVVVSLACLKPAPIAVLRLQTGWRSRASQQK
jgi:hypothetical protein